MFFRFCTLATACVMMASIMGICVARAETFPAEGLSAPVRELYQQLSTTPDSAQLWRRLGLQLRAEGQLRAAIGPLQRALALDQAADNRPHMAIGHNELAVTHGALATKGRGVDPDRGRAEHARRAIAAFTRAAELQQAIGNPLALGHNLRALAHLQRKLGQPGLAHTAFARAAEAFTDARRYGLAAETRAEAGL